MVLRLTVASHLRLSVKDLLQSGFGSAKHTSCVPRPGIGGAEWTRDRSLGPARPDRSEPAPCPDEDGVCQVIAEEQSDEVYVRVVVHCEDEDDAPTHRSRDYTDCLVRVWLDEPLGDGVHTAIRLRWYHS
jgi:hypothetical protein